MAKVVMKFADVGEPDEGRTEVLIEYDPEPKVGDPMTPTLDTVLAVIDFLKIYLGRNKVKVIE
jgi:hypothetical protein